MKSARHDSTASSPIIREGWVHVIIPTKQWWKRGEKKRWFILRENTNRIDYYSGDPRLRRGALKGSILLTPNTAIQGRSSDGTTAFLSAADKKKIHHLWTLRCKNQVDMDNWVQCIFNNIEGSTSSSKLPRQNSSRSSRRSSRRVSSKSGRIGRGRRRLSTVDRARESLADELLLRGYAYVHVNKVVKAVNIDDVDALDQCEDILRNMVSSEQLDKLESQDVRREKMIVELAAMGFSRREATSALLANSDDGASAIRWILDHRLEESKQASKSGAATAGADRHSVPEDDIMELGNVNEDIHVNHSRPLVALEQHINSERRTLSHHLEWIERKHRAVEESLEATKRMHGEAHDHNNSNGHKHDSSDPMSPDVIQMMVGESLPMGTAVRVDKAYEALDLSTMCDDTPVNKMNTMRNRVLREFVTTEQSYVQNLELCLEWFLKPLKAPGSSVLGQQEIQLIFGNLETIVAFNRQFFSDLAARIGTYALIDDDDSSMNGGSGGGGGGGPNSDNDEDEDDGDALAGLLRQKKRLVNRRKQKSTGHVAPSILVGDLLLSYAPFFKMYAAYVTNHTKTVAFFAKLRDESSRSVQKYERFVEFLADTEQRSELRGMKLESYLIMPCQRVPRYRLLVEELIKKTTEDHEDMIFLKGALVKIEQSARAMNEALRSYQDIVEVLEIQNAFGGRVTLIETGRRLLRQGEVTFISESSTSASSTDVGDISDIALSRVGRSARASMSALDNQKRTCQLFLFNNLLVVGERTRANGLRGRSQYNFVTSFRVNKKFRFEQVSGDGRLGSSGDRSPNRSLDDHEVSTNSSWSPQQKPRFRRMTTINSSSAKLPKASSGPFVFMIDGESDVSILQKGQTPNVIGGDTEIDDVHNRDLQKSMSIAVDSEQERAAWITFFEKISSFATKPDDASFTCSVCSSKGEVVTRRQCDRCHKLVHEHCSKLKTEYLRLGHHRRFCLTCASVNDDNHSNNPSPDKSSTPVRRSVSFVGGAVDKRMRSRTLVAGSTSSHEKSGSGVQDMIKETIRKARSLRSMHKSMKSADADGQEEEPEDVDRRRVQGWVRLRKWRSRSKQRSHKSRKHRSMSVAK